MPSKKEKSTAVQAKAQINAQTKRSTIILLMVSCTIFTALGQLFYKLGAEKIGIGFPWHTLIADATILLGCLFYGGSAIIMVLALKDGELSMVYPLVSLSFVWVALLSLIFLKESLGLLQWLGMIIIITGVSLVTLGAKQRKKESEQQGNATRGEQDA